MKEEASMNETCATAAIDSMVDAGDVVDLGMEDGDIGDEYYKGAM